jgi:acyl-CoA reductase-like NAD-dependent aldehyde dehydrogenase
LIGSSHVIAAVNALAEMAFGQGKFVITHQEPFNSEPVAPEFLEAFAETIAARKGAIMTLIQAETGTDLIDKKISNIVPGLNVKKYKAKKGDNDMAQQNEFKRHKSS